MRSTKWTELEIELLKTCGEKTIEEIKLLFPNRSEYAIRTKCSDYKIKILNNNDWTNEEISILTNNEGKTMSELLTLLPKRNILGIRGMAFKLKISIRAERFWTDEEINIVNKANNKLTLSQTLELLPNRTKQALKDFAKTNNIKFRRPTIWSDEEIELLKSVCDGEISLKEVYKLFPDRGQHTINQKIHQLGLRHLVTSYFKEWTTKEDDYLIKNYHKIKSKDLAQYFNVVPSGITERANYLGLDKKLIQIPYSDEEIKLLESIRYECLSLDEIFNLFPNRTIPSLRHILKKYKIQYNKKDYYSSDGFTKLKSIEERDIFDFIRNTFDVDITLANGRKFNNTVCCERYIPDYIIHKFNNIKLNKKLVIEYYGLYNLINPSGFVQEYIEKTHRKNKYYKSNSDIFFMDLYPEDLKNNFEGVRNKLTSFFMEKFNINIIELKEEVS